MTNAISSAQESTPEQHAARSSAESTPTLPTRDLAVEYLSRIVAVVILIFTSWKVYGAFVDAPSMTLLLALAGEVLTLGLVIFARIPKTVNTKPLIFLISFSSSLYFLLIDLSTEQTRQLVPLVLVVFLQLLGVTTQVGAKVWLGRSFGVLPANRGVVVDGPYRIVRHPIYLGYLFNHVGFFLFHASVRNALVYAGLYAIQITRIVHEEKILLQSDEYSDYASRVRYRLVPLAF